MKRKERDDYFEDGGFLESNKRIRMHDISELDEDYNYENTNEMEIEDSYNNSAIHTKIDCRMSNNKSTTSPLPPPRYHYSPHPSPCKSPIKLGSHKEAIWLKHIRATTTVHPVSSSPLTSITEEMIGINIRDRLKDDGFNALPQRNTRGRKKERDLDRSRSMSIDDDL